jgi:hypothetical protein
MATNRHLAVVTSASNVGFNLIIAADEPAIREAADALRSTAQAGTAIT